MNSHMFQISCRQIKGIKFIFVGFQDPEDESSKLFDDHLIETVANCFSSDGTDENIQVRCVLRMKDLPNS